MYTSWCLFAIIIELPCESKLFSLGVGPPFNYRLKLYKSQPDMCWWFPGMGPPLLCQLMFSSGGPPSIMYFSWWFPGVGPSYLCQLILSRGGSPLLCQLMLVKRWAPFYSSILLIFRGGPSFIMWIDAFKGWAPTLLCELSVDAFKGWDTHLWNISWLF